MVYDIDRQAAPVWWWYLRVSVRGKTAAGINVLDRFTAASGRIHQSKERTARSLRLLRPDKIMNMKDLRKRLQRLNLSKLARLSGVPLRTLRRLKNGDGDVLAATVARVEPHLRGAEK